MGCRSSKDGCRGEHRERELAKCVEITSEVPWKRIRTKSLFTYAELRCLWRVFEAAAGRAESRRAYDVESVTEKQTAPYDSVRGPEILPLRATLRKDQFLTACESQEASLFRLDEIVGAFGSRLFDVFDRDGDGRLSFEDFALGLSKLLKGPDSEKLKLMYSAYDLSGTAPSEGRCWGSKLMGKKLTKRSKYLTLEDMATVLTSASQGAYPTLLQFSEGGKCCGVSLRGKGTQDCSAKPDSTTCAVGSDYPSERKQEKQDVSPHQHALECALTKLAQRNAVLYAERAVSEFGQVHDGALTPKEFEKWAQTGPVLRCRLKEFSIDVNVVPFQGVRLV